jgi:hypothetical protein
MTDEKRATERRDVLAFLRAERAKLIEAARTFDESGKTDAASRCRLRASHIDTLSAYIERGDHEGAADR